MTRGISITLALSLILVFFIGGVSATAIYDSATNTIYVFGGGWENLTTINQQIANPAVLNETSPKVWFLNANLLVNDTTTTLYINSTDCVELRMNSTFENMAWINVTGRLEAADTTFTSWNTTTAAPEGFFWNYEQGRSNYRAFVVFSDGNVRNVTAKYLGYRPGFTTGDYWVTWTGFAVNQSSSYGVIENSTFLYNVFGVAFYKSSNKVIRYCNIHDYVSRGIEVNAYPPPYSDSENITIESNTIIKPDTFAIRLESAGYNHTIKNNTLIAFPAIEVYAGTGYTTIENNWIEARGSTSASTGALEIKAGGPTSIKDNIIFVNVSKAKANILIQETSNVYIKNTTLRSRSYYYHGIYITASEEVVLKDIMLEGQNPVNGVWIDDAYGSVLNVSFDRIIMSDFSGYGFYVSGDVDNLLIKNGVINNFALDGVYINSFGDNITIKNSIIVNNSHYGINVTNGGVVSTYNDVWNNTLGNYNGISSGIGDISVAPLFADPDNEDFHLKSQYGRWNGSAWVKDNVTSPCIDAGDPEDDYSNELDYPNGKINLGAYGNTWEASLGTSLANGTLSGKVTDKDTGLPIEGAIITANSHQTTTNSTGDYILSLPEGNYTVTASKNGYQENTSTAEILANQTTILNFTLKKLNVTVTAPANKWTSFRMHPSYDLTFEQISANLTNHQALSYYNKSIGLWQSYWAGYDFNKNVVVLERESLFAYFTAETNLNCSVPSPKAKPLGTEDTTPLYLRGYENKKIYEIKAALVSDGCNVVQVCGWDKINQEWNCTDDFVVHPSEGFIVQTSNNCVWREIV